MQRITAESQLETLRATVKRLKLDNKSVTSYDVMALRDELARMDEFGLANFVNDMRVASDLEDFIKKELS